MALNLQPEDFKGDPYGYITNQISHIFVGFSLVTVYSFVLNLSEYPNQNFSALMVTLGYFLCWELLYQGWRKFDTIEDTFFIGLGTAPFLFIDMQFVIDRLFISIVIMWLVLSVGLVRRL